MVRWQKELYSTIPQLKQLQASAFVLNESQEFIADFGKRERGLDRYPELMRELLKSFHETAEALEKTSVRPEREIDQIENHLHSLNSLEKAHRDYLLKLQSLSK